MTTKAKALVNGPAAAAMIAAGIGSLFLGIFTTGAVISEGLQDFLNFYNPAGPLSGKTTMSVIIWLISWVFLNARWKDKETNLARAFNITLALIAIGILLTFPPIFESFE